MRIRFVSHASFSVRSQGCTLITDPWLRAKAFNNGWALLSPAAEVSWPDVDFIWISHQHPDHFNFPTLKSIDPLQRRRLTVLYQKHASALVPKVLKSLGYENVHELKLNRWITLRPGVEIICGSVGSMDSWMAIRSEGLTILNLNDCVLSPGHLAHISRLVGRVNILLTQFSFANWIGNYKDEAGEAEKKLRDVRYRVEFLRPDFTIPFASFVYFCNQENSWMNGFAVTPRRVMELGLPGINFMYPGDEWDSEQPGFSSERAVDRYTADLVRDKKIDPTPPPVDPRNVVESANRLVRLLRSRFGRFLINRIPPFTIYLHDMGKVLIVNPKGDCELQDGGEGARHNARLVMCSQVAWYAFRYRWGWDALTVSGMYLDQNWREPLRLAFYMNLLSTEFVNLRGLRPLARTAEFFFAKRHELLARANDKGLGDSGQGDAVAKNGLSGAAA